MYMHHNYYLLFILKVGEIEVIRCRLSVKQQLNCHVCVVHTCIPYLNFFKLYNTNDINNYYIRDH